MKVKSFEALGKVLGINQKSKKPEKPRKCNKCGAILHKVEGTNVYICDGVDKKNNRPYEHKVYSRRPAV